MTIPAYGTPDGADLIAPAVEDAFTTDKAGRPSLLTSARKAASTVGDVVVNVGGAAVDVVDILDVLAPAVTVVGRAAGAIGDAAGALGETAGTVAGAIGDAVSSIDL